MTKKECWIILIQMGKNFFECERMNSVSRVIISSDWPTKCNVQSSRHDKQISDRQMVKFVHSVREISEEDLPF